MILDIDSISETERPATERLSVITSYQEVDVDVDYQYSISNIQYSIPVESYSIFNTTATDSFTRCCSGRTTSTVPGLRHCARVVVW